jgi:exodeoxyribonuclease VII large subunit
MQGLLQFPEFTALTVSQVTQRLRGLVEKAFPAVTVVGEITSLSRATSGHRYFNLRDANAILHAVVWRDAALRLDCEPANGLEVIAGGRITVYGPHGYHQLVIDEMVPRGAGRQDRALRLLKEKLHGLGYFAAERKKPLPRFPRRIALVTSPHGAAVRDMLEILLRRWPVAEITVCPVRVQGADAPPQIAGMLGLLSRVRHADVILLGRGGGSSDDLSAFNDERVARAIFHCPIPIVSAVGHEIDVTIADMVADCRALTPSEAAERATPDRGELIQSCRDIKRRLGDRLLTRLRAARERVAEIADRPVFRRPLERPRELARRLDDIDARLKQAWRRRLEVAKTKLAAIAGRLDSLSPLNVLARGYSLTRTADGRLVRSVSQVEVGEPIEIVLADGRLAAEVREVRRPT